MSIEFADSARKHFAEDRLDERLVLDAIAHPLWVAMVDPDDSSVAPPADTKPPTILMVCKRHLGALDDDLIELLVSMPRPGVMRIFHAMHLSGIWRDYWNTYR